MVSKNFFANFGNTALVTAGCVGRVLVATAVGSKIDTWGYLWKQGLLVA